MDASVLKGVNPLLDTQALKVVRGMPLWIPGKLDGLPETFSFTLPVSFEFTYDEKSI